jgi:hypothetical protein
MMFLLLSRGLSKVAVVIAVLPQTWCNLAGCGRGCRRTDLEQWSDGRTHQYRVKTLKRQMYGRAEHAACGMLETEP